MTVQALRNEVGDDAFWRIVRKWTAQRDEHGTTPEFIALAERISGQQLDDLFDVWLFRGEKPASPSAAAATRQAPAAVNGDAAAFAQQWMARMSDLLKRDRL